MTSHQGVNTLLGHGDLDKTRNTATGCFVFYDVAGILSIAFAGHRGRSPECQALSHKDFIVMESVYLIGNEIKY